MLNVFFRKVLRTGEMLNMLNVPPSIPFLNPYVAFYNDFQKESNEKHPLTPDPFRKPQKQAENTIFVRLFSGNLLFLQKQRFFWTDLKKGQ